MPFTNYRRGSAEKLKAREDEIEESKKQQTLKIETRIGILQNRNILRPGILHLHPDLLPGENGAQTKRVSVLIGSQLIGTAEINFARLRHGSHTPCGNEVIFIDPHKGIHDDENNVVCDGVHLFAISAICLVCCERCVKTVIVPFYATSMTLFAHFLLSFFMTVLLKPSSQSAHCVIPFMCVVTKKRFRWDCPCNHHLADLLSVSSQKRKNHSKGRQIDHICEGREIIRCWRSLQLWNTGA